MEIYANYLLSFCKQANYPSGFFPIFTEKETLQFEYHFITLFHL